MRERRRRKRASPATRSAAPLRSLSRAEGLHAVVVSIRDEDHAPGRRADLRRVVDEAVAPADAELPALERPVGAEHHDAVAVLVDEEELPAVAEVDVDGIVQV